jgi:hypothetical protein
MLYFVRPSYSGQRRTDVFDRKNEREIFHHRQEHHLTHIGEVKQKVIISKLIYKINPQQQLFQPRTDIINNADLRNPLDPVLAMTCC